MMFDYPMDLSKVGDSLFLAFRHCGLYVYTKSKDTGLYEFKCNDKPANGYTPTYIQWLTEGEQMLLLGNDNIVQYNVSNTSKLKRYKAAKIKTDNICEALVERDNELLVVGEGSKWNFIITMLSPDTDGINVLQTPKIKCKAKVERGVTVKDNYLLVVGKEAGFHLFEAGV